MTEPRFVSGVDSFDDWREDLLTGRPPVLFPVADSGPLARIEIGPKLITLVGGAPGSGKTAFVMQATIDALRLSPNLRAVVCNIEMPPAMLLDRQLARLSGIPLKLIRYRRLTSRHASRVDAGLATLESVADRICFCRPPFDLGNIAGAVDSFAPLAPDHGTLIVADYLQRIAPPGAQSDRRGSIDATMNFLRQFADAGAAVVVVSSVGRQKDSRGRSTYAGEALNLASFKESGELEFGADDAFILAPEPNHAGVHRLMHLKARYSNPADMLLAFDRATQRFEPLEQASSGNPTEGGVESLSELWRRCAPAGGES